METNEKNQQAKIHMRTHVIPLPWGTKVWRAWSWNDKDGKVKTTVDGPHKAMAIVIACHDTTCSGNVQETTQRSKSGKSFRVRQAHGDECFDWMDTNARWQYMDMGVIMAMDWLGDPEQAFLDAEEAFLTEDAAKQWAAEAEKKN